jgi:hypothetical protein
VALAHGELLDGDRISYRHGQGKLWNTSSRCGAKSCNNERGRVATKVGGLFNVALAHGELVEEQLVFFGLSPWGKAKLLNM